MLFDFLNVFNTLKIDFNIQIEKRFGTTVAGVFDPILVIERQMQIAYRGILYPSEHGTAIL
jgi:hypothetical protein